MATIRPVSISAAFFTSANAPDPNLTTRHPGVKRTREKVGQPRAPSHHVTTINPCADSRFQENKSLKDFSHPPLISYSLPTHALVDPSNIMVHLRDRSH